MDLTKYLEEHHFSFDNAFDSSKDNVQVSAIGSDKFLDLLNLCATLGVINLPRFQHNMFCLRPNRVGQNAYDAWVSRWQKPWPIFAGG